MEGIFSCVRLHTAFIVPLSEPASPPEPCGMLSGSSTGSREQSPWREARHHYGVWHPLQQAVRPLPRGVWRFWRTPRFYCIKDDPSKRQGACSPIKYKAPEMLADPGISPFLCWSPQYCTLHFFSTTVSNLICNFLNYQRWILKKVFKWKIEWAKPSREDTEMGNVKQTKITFFFFFWKLPSRWHHADSVHLATVWGL